MPISTGTIAAKADDGSRSSSTAPATPPISEATPSRSTRVRCPARSGRIASAPDSEPGASPTVLETLATTGGTPEGQQGREGDQGARPDHGVDQAGGRPGPEQGQQLQPGHRSELGSTLRLRRGWSVSTAASVGCCGASTAGCSLRQPAATRRTAPAPERPRWPPAPCARASASSSAFCWRDLVLDVDLLRRRELTLGGRRESPRPPSRPRCPGPSGPCSARSARSTPCSRRRGRWWAASACTGRPAGPGPAARRGWR